MDLCTAGTQQIAMAVTDYGLISLNDFLSLNEHSQLKKEWKILSSHHGIQSTEGLTKTRQPSRDNDSSSLLPPPPLHPGYPDRTSGTAIPWVSFSCNVPWDPPTSSTP